MKIFDFLTSVRLTMVLLLGLALAAVFGTLNVPAPGRYEVYFQSPWFRLAVALLAVNMAACTLKTIGRNRRDRDTWFTRLVAGAATLKSDLDPGADRDALEQRLQGAGYGIQRRGDLLVAEQGRLGRWGSTVVHVSVLVIMAGALASGLGFVGTLNIYVDHESDTYFDWQEQADLPLGFTFRLDAFSAEYHPIDIEITAYEPATRRELRTWVTREGDSIEFPEAGVGARVRGFDPHLRILTLDLFAGGRALGEYRASAGAKTFWEGVDVGVIFMPTGFRDPILRETRSTVSILEEGRVVAAGEISINRPLVHEGVAIYQTAFDRDPYGFWYAGFQFSRDPGKPLVWTGSITLMLGLLLTFLLPYRVVGLVEVDGAPRLVALRGFHGEGGAISFERLRDAIL
ncbi:cytochrome c biogenesis protein ResB [Geoalkalibacter halelectricus]|uniref:Cytochrome c biogenesis protein ResB n=1 Tax=Geoalkalibacter halelectricus TaxID=2847045 RepID=A0ABY5ZPV7_9BACT|nr:cytochrome c biogenesis protein ResB [Geoalkalibacter halelectricus]MDO3378770.1 cytochrome c biogenesis protein ResB [Geoalkalibacter halelectricus]UWZ79925.1 cytochrome c biogenesis protein ResB [Geoalkalibacter halelectricus]